ncbi:MAG: hypothetical protein OXD34_14000 [bacterium]|nr:hypothetical protein [bacterium]
MSGRVPEIGDTYTTGAGRWRVVEVEEHRAAWHPTDLRVTVVAEDGRRSTWCRPLPAARPCPCACASGGWCGGCGHAGCGGR